MNHHAFASPLAFALPLALAGACGLFSSHGAGPAQVNELVGWVERVHVEAELARDRVRDAIQALAAIAASDLGGDPVSVYARFVQATERSEQQAARLRAQVEPMKKAAGPLFAQWAADLKGFASPAMRQRSETRLAETRKLYDAILAAVDPAQSSFAAFNKSVRDHALFLGHDFNAASVAAIQDDVRALRRLAAELEAGFEGCMRESRAYVIAAALPVNAVPEVAAPPGGARSGNGRPLAERREERRDDGVRANR